MRHFSNKLNKEFIEDLRSYLLSYNEMKSEKRIKTVESAFEAMDSYYDKTRPMQKVSASMPAECAIQPSINIEIAEKEPSFCENLFKIIDSKGLKDSEVYKKADIDRRLFSKIRSDSDYHPAKNTAIRLCLALELDIVQAENLLETAGYCLSLSDTTDLVIRYCIEHKIFDIISVNEAIDYFSGKLI